MFKKYLTPIVIIFCFLCANPVDAGLKPYGKMSLGGGGDHIPGGDTIGFGFLNLTAFVPATKKMELLGAGLFRQVKEGSQVGVKLGTRFRLPALGQMHTLGVTGLRSEEHENFLIFNLKSKKRLGTKTLLRLRYDQPLSDRKQVGTYTDVNGILHPVYQRVGNFLGMDIVFFPGTKRAFRLGVHVTDLFGPDRDDEGATYGMSGGVDVNIGDNTAWNVASVAVDDDGNWSATTGISYFPGKPSPDIASKFDDSDAGVGGDDFEVPVPPSEPVPDLEETIGVQGVLQGQSINVNDLYCVQSAATGELICTPR